MTVKLDGVIQRVTAHGHDEGFKMEIVLPEGIFHTNGILHLELDKVAAEDLQEHLKVTRESIFKLSGKKINIVIKD